MTASPWRAELARRRALPCPACGHTGPHAARCTPWHASLWGDVRCTLCDRFVDWLPQPPRSDAGASKLHAQASAQMRAMDALESLLDALALRWPLQTSAPSHLTLTDESGAPPRLTDAEARQIDAAVADVRAAFGWSPDEWRWSDAQHAHRRHQAYTHPGQARLV